MEKAHILIADDSLTLVKMLARQFRQEGYQVSEAFNGLEVIPKIVECQPDLVLLDYYMPGLTGLAVIELIKKQGLQMPAIVLMTAQDSDEIHVNCLKAGCDYVTLPASIDVLRAHVEAGLLRSPVSDSLHKLRFADLEVDKLDHSAYRGSRRIKLTPTEYRLLVYLMENPRRVLSRDQIIQQVWKRDDGYSNVVDSCIARLRRKMEKGGERRLIQTLHEAGYILRIE